MALDAVMVAIPLAAEASPSMSCRTRRRYDVTQFSKRGAVERKVDGGGVGTGMVQRKKQDKKRKDGM